MLSVNYLVVHIDAKRENLVPVLQLLAEILRMHGHELGPGITPLQAGLHEIPVAEQHRVGHDAEERRAH